MVTVSDIYNSDLETLLIVFFNTVKETEDYFLVKSEYKNSTLTSKKLDTELLNLNNELISNYFKVDFTNKSTETVGKHCLYIEKDFTITFEEFMSEIYSKIQQLRFTIDKDDFDKILILSSIVPRGSVDVTGNKIAVDLYEKFISDKYIEMILNLFISTSSLDQLNLNFRQLQKQYVEGSIKRNSQFRINLKWFYDKYFSDLILINKHKYNIINDNINVIKELKYQYKSHSFLERMIFYKERIINPNFSFDDLSSDELKRQVKELRAELDFSDSEIQGTTNRNRKVVALANAILPEECVCCKDDYPIEARTFKRRNSEKFYFELHHVISFTSNKDGDILENLVKVCPACHRALTPGRADELYQKDLIKNILNNSEEANEYVGNFIKDTHNFNDKVEYIYTHLK